MIGSIIAKIRKDKNLTKTKLSDLTGINIGHITHIEKEERHPSHKSLKLICDALNVPYQPLMLTYDKELAQKHLDYKIENHINYNQITAFDNLDNLIDCPQKYKTATFALKMQDDSMEPTLKKDSYIYIEENTPLESKDIGIFKYNNNIIIRKFIIRKDDLVLRAENKSYKEIILSKKDNFLIIGKVLITK